MITAKCAPYLARGKPERRTELMNLTDLQIISAFGAEYRGIVQYYLLAGDVWRLNRLEWVASTSMLKTLAAKHGSTVTTMARKYKAKADTPHGQRTCFEARVERAGRKPLGTRFGGIPLIRQKKAVLTDLQPAPATGRKELTTRLLARRCEWCEQHATVEIHQVRRLADLTSPGRPQPAWAHLMATMRRKTLVVCIPCHQAIHAGQPASAPRNSHWRATCRETGPRGSDRGPLEKDQPHGRHLASGPSVCRLRLNGLIRRLPHTNRYVLTADGIRIAVFYTKVYNRLLVPLIAANQPQAPPELRAALAAITRHVDGYANHARLPRAA